MNTVLEIYKSQSLKCHEVLLLSFNEGNMDLIASNHAAIDDYASLIHAIKDRPEVDIMKNAVREYQMSFLANVMGMYNVSFAGLRFFLERMMCGILFSAKELELRLWMSGGRDFYWQEVCDNDKGIFSPSFCRAFFPSLEDEVNHYRALCFKVYRECSEYVHGNAQSQTRLPAIISHDATLVAEWHDKADTIKQLVFFAYCLRYLSTMDPTSKKAIENPILDQLSHIEQVRAHFTLK